MIRFGPDRLRDSDVLVKCPECGGRHVASVGKVRTPVIRSGTYVSLDTGDIAQCLRCGQRFLATDEGALKLPHSLAPPAPASAPAPEPNSPVGPRLSPLPVPKQRPAV